ncbi:MAG: tyrosine-type recombinase/integrase [Cutibacterium sp.]|nr:tyrosine-type recombinase/integrase [Cutibacterium sp.]
MDHNNLYHREYKALLKKAGLQDQGFTFHALRHTFATALFMRSEHPKVVQSLLGHSSITQTMDTYSHLCSKASAVAPQTAWMRLSVRLLLIH